ncbi:MAG: peptidoglycan-binding domain-containing protein [Candidatus Paceibacterota bacterium]
MSNLLKSKFLLSVVFVAVMFVGAVALNATPAAAADCSITSTLRVGSKGVQVQCLQTALGITADGSFGPKTKAAVVAFQANSGLVADGIFGPKSRAVWMANTGVSSFAPAGCTAASGFSPVTGGACYAVSSSSSLPAGCTSTAGFSPTTGASCATGAVTGQTGPVTVSLASDTPASSSFIVPASGVQFAKYTFTGAGTVTSVKLQRTGVSASTTVSNVYLYDGATRITDGASIGSDNTLTFNAPSGIFTVAGSKTITVVADTLVADYSLGFTLVGYTANTVASVVSVAGNQMFGASATLAVVTLSAATGSGATDAGPDITIWQGTATVATRDVLLKSLALRQIGSIATADINNFKLYADGVLISSTAALNSSGYVTFAPSAVLKTGARTLKVTADIVGGSGRTVQLSLRGAYDILATDTQYNANGTAAGTFPFGPAVFTVNNGTLTVVKKTDSQSSNVTLGASDQSLATYTFTAYGEPIKVETLRVGMVTTGGTVTDHSLRNVRILVNGAQVGSNTTVPAAATFAAASGTSFTTNFIVYPGTPATVAINSDIFDNEGTDEIASGAVTAVQAMLVGGAATANGVPQVSITAINVPTTANVTGNTLTISSGSMSVATTSSYVNRSIAVPQTAYKIGSYQLSGNSTEAVNLNTIYVGWTAGSTVAEATDLSDLYVVYGGTMSAVKGTVIATDLNGNSWSINKTLAKNETIQIDVYATLASTVSINAIISTLAVAGTTASSGIATYADASGITTLTAGVTGQTITGATGSITASQDASTVLAQIVDDSAVVKSLTAKIVAVTDAYTVTDVTVTVSNVSAVSTVTLKDSVTGAVIGTAKSAQTSLTWSGLALAVDAGTTKKIDVELVLSPVGVSAGTTGSLLTTAITAFTARNSAGTSATGTGTATGNVIYVYKAIPTVSSLAIPSTTLVAGTNTISKFSVNSGGTGTIAWNRMIFNVAKTSAPVIANGAAVTLWNADSGTQVGGTAVIISADATYTCTAAALACKISFVPTNEQQVTGSVNYVLKAVVGGTLIATDYISTTLSTPPSVFAASTDYPSVAATGSFVAATYASYATTPSFIWSDVSASAHATTVTTDWSNDYLVRLLPLDSQTLTK